ncbi:hypothetical protein QOZ80_2AG0102890 [Eleusine coracana subsp. coracana]|nr:hypothetical protein QOZ80_2AG0102890 [Eleusine coracana subsp. coracana]
MACRRRDRRRERILDIIYGHFKEALDALPLEHILTLVPHLLDAGVCFGFADPVTNIIANTLCLVTDEDGDPNTKCVKKRKKALSAAETREEVLSKIAVGDVPSPPEARTIAERSLKGLIVFLTTYFRHLPTENAMSYLYLARADLLVAVRLIEIDRCLRQKYQFCTLSHAIKAALRCAALAARVPMVDSFLGAMFGLVSHLKLITQTVAAESPRHLSHEDVRYLSGLLKKP